MDKYTPRVLSKKEGRKRMGELGFCRKHGGTRWLSKDCHICIPGGQRCPLCFSGRNHESWCELAPSNVGGGKDAN